jgi:periplasmic protein TonB
METKQRVQSLDDIVFENRNKAYGAYAMRQSYQSEALKGAVTSIGFVVGIFIVAGILNGKSILPTLPKEVPIFTPGTPPIIKADIIPAAPREKTPPRVNRELPPQVITTPEQPIEQTPESTITSTGTEGTGTSTETSTTGTGIDTGTETGIETTVKPTGVFTHAEVMPAYKGGFKAMMKFVVGKVKYPASSRRLKNQGTVLVQFIVNDQGEVTDVEVIKGVDVACDQEAIRVISMLDEWTPGMQNKMPVNVRMVLPVTFKIAE